MQRITNQASKMLSKSVSRRRSRSLARSISFESLETRTLMSTYSVTSTDDSGLGTLRQAIINANANPGSNTINFNIPGGGIQTITPQSPLPALSGPATVDATTMPGYTGTPLIELSGIGAGGGAIGLELDGAGSKVSGLTIDNFDAVGLLVGPGATGTIVSNNFIGTDSSGALPGPNGDGIVVGGANSTISNNVISGNNVDGVLVLGNGVSIRSNFVGTDFTGTAAIPNLWGVLTQSAGSVTIGGSSSDRNIISGNMREGVTLDHSPNSTVSNNYIGTDVTGNIALMNNGDGVDLISSDSSTVRNNLIAASGGDGVFLFGTSSSTIAGNLIGTDVTGTQTYDSLGDPLGNGGNGVSISSDSFNDTLGGTSPLDRNIISNNFGNGVMVNSTDSLPLLATITGNYIGIDITGTLDLPNVGNGVKAVARGTTISNNVISGNYANGIAADGNGATIQGNFIGTDASGAGQLPNFADGVYVTGSSESVFGNTIAFNAGNGVTIADGTGNVVRGNAIFANSALGIDLNADGVTTNDSQGHHGPNNFQNFPVLGVITRYAGGVIAAGTIDATPNSTFTLDFYTSTDADPTGYGQGQHSAGSVTITTGVTGHGIFSAFLTNLVAGQSVLSATATDASGNTSEFGLDAMIPAIVSQAGSSTTLSSSLNPATVGTSVTFTAHVTGSIAALGAPSGSVLFKDGSTVLGSGTVDGSGNASFSSSSLSIGGHTITAVYSGDSTFTISTSSPLTETITAIGTSTTVSSSLNPSNFGDSVTFTAHVGATSATMNLLTGSVTFMDGSIVLGSGSVDANGNATLTTSSLEVGGHTITAIYSGDSTFTSSTSPSLTQTVNALSTVTTLSSSLNPSTFGDSVTFTATVTGATGTPSGMVNFMDGSSLLGTGTLDANGRATFSTTSLSVGGHTITATYAGDAHFTMSVSSPLTQNVAAPMVGTTTTLSSSANPSILGNMVVFTAAVTGVSGSNIPSGTVTFMEGSTVLGTASVDSNGMASFATSSLSLGGHTLTATYSGDSAFLASVSAPLTQTVNPVPVLSVNTTTAVASSSNPAVFGSAVTFTAAVAPVSSSSNALSGTVTFMDGSAVLGTVAVDSTGHAMFSSSDLSIGGHTITAAYSGDANFNSSMSSPLAQSVTAISTATTLSSSSNPSLVGAPVTFTATVASTNSGMTPSGSVTFMDGSTVLGTVALDSAGHAVLATSTLSVGSHTISAVYAGTATFTASTSANLTQTVNMIGTTTTVSSSMNPAPFGTSVMFTANVAATSSTMNILTGTVTFKDGSTVLGTASVAANGSAVFNTSTLIVGNHSITATYSGDANFTGSASSSLNESITAIGTSTTVVSSANPSNSGSAVTFTATVTPSSNPGALTGTVTFKDGSTVLGTGTLDASGHATFTTSALSVGSHAITATYAGTTNFTGSASAPLTQTVNAVYVATTTSLASSANPTVVGCAVTFTATVSHGASTLGTLTGTVTFKDGSTVLGTGTVNASGVATFTTSSLSIGSHTITAVYGGDSHYTTSTSAPLTQTVTAATATVDGHIYNDVTGNGLSSDDTALSGVTVKLYRDINGNGVLDSGDGAAVMSAVTGSNGLYSFGGLAIGRYFVQETTPTGYVRTAPALSTYYTFNATGGASAHDDFDNYMTCACSSDVTKITYTINGCKTVSDLRGQVHQGDTVMVKFTVLTGHTVTLSLVSYTAPGSTFVADDADEQKISQLATGTFGPGTYTMTVVVPKCYFQVDFVCGYAIDQFGPAGSNVFYSAQQRLFSADNGGTNAPKN